LRHESIQVHVNYGEYFLADPDSYPGMGGPDPEEFPDFSRPGPLVRVQAAEGIVLLTATLHTGTLAVRYLLSDEPLDRSDDHPDLVGEVTVQFPTGLAELRGLMADPSTDTSMLNGRPGAYRVRLEARAAGGEETHVLAVWPITS
jgi:hypothetical protein